MNERKMNEQSIDNLVNNECQILRILTENYECCIMNGTKVIL